MKQFETVLWRCKAGPMELLIYFWTKFWSLECCLYHPKIPTHMQSDTSCSYFYLFASKHISELIPACLRLLLLSLLLTQCEMSQYVFICIIFGNAHFWYLSNNTCQNITDGFKHILFICLSWNTASVTFSCDRQTQFLTK